MKKNHLSAKRVAAALFVLMLLIPALSWAGPYYLRSTVGAPWGVSTNETAMDTAFGAGNWTDARYETVDIGALFSTPQFIFMEGGDHNANEMESFLTTHGAAINSFVNNGGVILFNAAPNEGDGMDFGFGVTLTYPNFEGPGVTGVNPAHPIFNGPFGVTGVNFTGSAFSHATVSGAGLTALITADDDGLTVLGEMAIGSGFALFGGMTTDNFHNPDPNAAILRANILAYAAAQVGAAGVPAPAGLALLGIGLIALGVKRRA